MTRCDNSLGINVNQPVYTGGELTGKIRKSDAIEAIALNHMKVVENDTKMTILRSYLELFKNRNLLGVYDENITITRQLIDEMKARVNQGLMLDNDVIRCDLNLSNLGYDLLTVVNRISNFNYSLLSYLHLLSADGCGRNVGGSDRLDNQCVSVAEYTVFKFLLRIKRSRLRAMRYWLGSISSYSSTPLQVVVG